MISKNKQGHNNDINNINNINNNNNNKINKTTAITQTQKGGSGDFYTILVFGKELIF